MLLSHSSRMFLKSTNREFPNSDRKGSAALFFYELSYIINQIKN